jgi:hypothetical protein
MTIAAAECLLPDLSAASWMVVDPVGAQAFPIRASNGVQREQERI